MSFPSQESLSTAKVTIGDARRVSRKVLSRLAQMPGRGNVAAVFDRSFLIEMERPFLIHVGSLMAPLTPRSILLGEAEFLRIRPILSPKQAVLADANGIAWLESPLRIAIDQAEIICHRSGFQGGPLSGLKILDNLIECLGTVEQIRGGRGNISPLTGYVLSRLQILPAPSAERARPPDSAKKISEITIRHREILWSRIDGLVDFLRRESWEEVQRELPEIIGFGPGLTPSGDDFLAGFLSAGSVMGRRSPEARRLVHRLGEIILTEAKGRTTVVSMAMLEDAVEGEMSEPISDFLNSIFSGNMETISGTLEKILSIGGSSGEDQLNGLAAGFFFFQRFQGGG